ncbi:MAG: hypothetical protein HYY52_05690 [Candidatus Melainabacteria bacterium]|nr:hypothetical protein [Candidatus Melainabacteria bacterium]
MNKNDDPLKELHKIRGENYKKTKNMNAKEYFAYISKGAREFEKLRKQVRPVKNIDKLFSEFKRAG